MVLYKKIPVILVILDSMSDIGSPSPEYDIPNEKDEKYTEILFSKRFFKLPAAYEPEVILNEDPDKRYEKIKKDMAVAWLQAIMTRDCHITRQFTLRVFEPTPKGVQKLKQDQQKVDELLSELPEKLYEVMKLIYSIYCAMGNEFLDRKNEASWKLRVSEWGRRQLAHIYCFTAEIDISNEIFLWNGAYINGLYDDLLFATPSHMHGTAFLPTPKWSKSGNKFIFVKQKEYETKVTPMTHPESYFNIKQAKTKLKIPAFKSSDARLEAYMQISQV